MISPDTITNLLSTFIFFYLLLSSDIIFFIYLYQRWVYREDPNRVNEFGSSGAHPEGVPEDADITSEGKFCRISGDGNFNRVNL